MTSYYTSPSSPLDFPCPQQRNNNHKNFIISGGIFFYRTLTRCDSRTLHINKPRNFFFTSHPKQITPGLDPPFKKAYQLPRRHRHRHPSWNCACGNGAWSHPSSSCAWPNAGTGGTTSSCHPSWRTPFCARNVSSAPWLLGTTGA